MALVAHFDSSCDHRHSAAEVIQAHYHLQFGDLTSKGDLHKHVHSECADRMPRLLSIDT